MFDEVIEPILGLSFKKDVSDNESLEDELIKYIIELRNNARSEKRFDISDNIRDNLSKMGITLKDGKDGTSYEK
jgi:cysteinyl-tRNA synthetase